LRDYNADEWNEVVSESSKCLFYKEFKNELVYENYLNKLDISLKYSLIKFRTSNHKLPIKRGRYFNVPKKCLVMFDISFYHISLLRSPVFMNL
jgi:hypothetical protein